MAFPHVFVVVDPKKPVTCQYCGAETGTYKAIQPCQRTPIRRGVEWYGVR